MSEPGAAGAFEGVRAVIFDAGNTLLWLCHDRIAEVLRGHGIDSDTESVRLAEMQARPRLDPHLAKATKREGPAIRRFYVTYLLENLGVTPDEALLEAVLEDLQSQWQSLWTCAPADARETLDTLAAQGYVLAVVSNSDGTVEQLLTDAGLRDPLACVVDSRLVGFEKPDPRIFQAALALLDLPAEACVYVGDFHAIDVVGARAAGLRPVLIDPAGVWGDVTVPRVRQLSELSSLLAGF